MHVIKVHECIEKIISKSNYKGGRTFSWNIHSTLHDSYWIQYYIFSMNLVPGCALTMDRLWYLTTKEKIQYVKKSNWIFFLNAI